MAKPDFREKLDRIEQDAQQHYEKELARYTAQAEECISGGQDPSQALKGAVDVAKQYDPGTEIANPGYYACVLLAETGFRSIDEMAENSMEAIEQKEAYQKLCQYGNEEERSRIREASRRISGRTQKILGDFIDTASDYVRNAPDSDFIEDSGTVKMLAAYEDSLKQLDDRIAEHKRKKPLSNAVFFPIYCVSGYILFDICYNFTEITAPLIRGQKAQFFSLERIPQNLNTVLTYLSAIVHPVGKMTRLIGVVGFLLCLFLFLFGYVISLVIVNAIRSDRLDRWKNEHQDLTGQREKLIGMHDNALEESRDSRGRYQEMVDRLKNHRQDYMASLCQQKKAVMAAQKALEDKSSMLSCIETVCGCS